MKRKFARLVLLVAFAVMALGVSMPAEAVSVGLTGFVNSAGPTPFGIVLSTPLTGLATFDAVLAASAPGGLLNYLDDLTMALQVQLGTFSFDSASDPFLDLTYGFSGTSLANIALLGGTGSADWGLDITFDSLGDVNVFAMTDLDFITQVTGGVSAVPVPATLILLVTGAAVLIGAGRRRARQF